MRIEPRRVGLALAILAFAVGGWVALDALIVTDEERIEAFADAISGTVEPGHLDQVLRDWTDPPRQPLTVTALGRSEVYDQSERLRADARRALRTYEGEDLTRLRQGLEIAEDEAHLTLEMLSGRGMIDLEVELRRHGERWLVSEVRIYR